MSATVVVDMGGTSTRVGVYDEGRLLAGTVRFATPKPARGGTARGGTACEGTVREQHLDLIAAEADRLRSAHPGLREVGVAAGATVDARGRIRNAAMLWGETSAGVDLTAAIQARLPWADVLVRNDIAAAAWRYQELGRFAVVTVSTGVAIQVFDDRLPLEDKLFLDADGLGGEVGHVLIDHAVEGRQNDEPWCECGNVGDLCSYTSGPAAARMAARFARADPDQWHESALYSLCDGRQEQISTQALARAAQQGDDLALRVLDAVTRPLAVLILQLSAQLGLRRFIVMGGFAHGAGIPWFSALRSNLGALRPTGGWFTGWTDADLDALVSPSIGDDNDSLLGMGKLIDARRARIRELSKPVGENRAVLRYRSRPRCGREQFAARIVFAGICGTDLQILRGERGCEPDVLGHECVAQIAEAGADVPDIRPGQVVAINPNHPHDEHDKLGHNQPGVFREIAIWDRHMAERGQVIPVPDDVSAEWVLLEPLACAVRSLRAGGPDLKGRRVLVIGAGVSGLLHVFLARQRQAETVLLANRGEQRLRAAVARGMLPAQDCLVLGDDLGASIAAATDGAGLDSVIVAVSGNIGPSVMASLWPCLADDAKVHLFGGFPADATISTPDGSVLPTHPIRSRGEARQVCLPGGRRCTLVGSRGAEAEDFQVAKDTIGTAEPAGPRLSSLISHVVSLDAAPAVMKELAHGGWLAGEPAMRVAIDLRLHGQVIERVDQAERLPSITGAR